jgi:SAM-dependent methyltransferase
MNITELTNGLVTDEHGIWTHAKCASISYPNDGNQQCFQLEDESFWFSHRNDCIISVLKRFPPNGTILDVGGGNGYVTRRLLDEGFEAVLLEPGAVGALNGKKNRDIPEVICSTLKDAGFPEGSLDAVGCFDVIEHVKDDRDFIAHILTLLKPEGTLYLTVPAHQWLWSQSDVTAGHFRRYDRRMIEELLVPRIEILFFTYFFRILALPIFLLRTVPSKVSFFRRAKLLSNELEHGSGNGRTIRILEHLMRNELSHINSGKSLRFGSSCLVVARKTGARV